MKNYNQVIHVNWLDKRTTKVLILQAVLLLQMQLRPVAHFWVVATAKQQQSNSKATANPPKSDDINGQEMFD